MIKVTQVHSVKEMQEEINRLRNIDPLVNSCMRMADFNEMSSEDRYVFLAYNALISKIEVQDALYDAYKRLPKPFKTDV